jgi:hypothetical protein
MIFVIEVETLVLKFVEEHKNINNQSKKSKKINVGCIAIFYFKLYPGVRVTKTAQYWHKNSHLDQ